MGLRFQKRVRLFPGVRLNFSASGVSASFGVRGASVTVGKSGTYLNVGLPGTGLSYRTKLNKRVQGAQAQPAVPVEAPPSSALVPPEPGNEDGDALLDGFTYTGKRVFQSRHPDTLSSPNLRDLADLASEANARRGRISASIVTCRNRISWAKFWHGVGKFFLFRPLFTRTRIDAIATAISKMGDTKTELEELLEAAVIDIDFGFGEAAKGAYGKSIAAFRTVASSERIWDIPTSYDINRRTTRSAAAHSLTMKKVRLTTSSIDEFGTEFQAMQFGNVNGADLYLMPGFLALRRSGGGLALIDHKDLSIEAAPTQFVETGSRAGDAEQVGSAWKKSNKDGSRDRRFKGNFQIPIMLYGDIRITSTTGLNERYMVTNWRALSQFREELASYRRAVSRERAKGEELSTDVPFDQVPDLVLPEIPRIRGLVGAATVVRTLVLACVIAGGLAAARVNPVGHDLSGWLAEFSHRASPVATASVPDAPVEESPAKPVSAVVSSPSPTAPGTPKSANAPSVPNSPDVPKGLEPSKAAATPTANPAPADDSPTAAEISNLQGKLEGLGYYSGPVNGRAGKDTLAAFNAWRSETGRPTVAKLSRADLNAFLRAISR